MSAFNCKNCERTFKDGAHLRRHLARVVPCTKSSNTPPSYICKACGKTYLYKSGLYKHSQTCAPRAVNNTTQNSLATTTVVQNIHIHAPTVIGNISAIGTQIHNERLPGWPAKWPQPPHLPHPFDPASFIISYELLQQAAARAGDIPACCRGDPGAIAKLFVELMKLIHENPDNRNIYLNPDRCDQVLVYVPHRWAIMSLCDALCATFDHVYRELKEIASLAPEDTQALVHAAQKSLDTKKSNIINCATPAMSAHLRNLSTRLATPLEEKWLGDLAGVLESQRPLRRFCYETHAHMMGAPTISAFEIALQVYRDTDVTVASMPVLARRLILTYAKMVLSGHPENLTVILAGDVAYVHSYAGCWEATPISDAAARQTRAFAEFAASYIELQRSKLLAPIAAYIRAHIDELAAEEGTSRALLTQYAAEAERYYTQTTGQTLEVPRRLLCSRQPAAPTAVALTDSDVDDLVRAAVDG